MNVAQAPSVTSSGPPDVPWLALLVGLGVVVGLPLLLAARDRRLGVGWLGFRLGLRGLVMKELRSRSRGWRPMWLLLGYLGALTLAVAGFLALSTQPSPGRTISATLGLQLFSALAFGLVLLLAFITPALTVGSISGERERRTLDLLLVTRASALGLVVGKLAGSLFAVLLLLLASLPAFAIVYLFGGVPLAYLGLVLLIACATALAHAALGLLLSGLLRRTALASVAAYLVVLALVLGPPAASVFVPAAGPTGRLAASSLMVSSQSGPSSFIASHPAGVAPPMMGGPSVALWAAGPPPLYTDASPLVVLSSLLPASPGGSPPGPGSYGGPGSIRPPGLNLAYSLYVVRADPTTGEMNTVTTWAPWVYYALLSVGLAVLGTLGAAAALARPKRWRVWRARRRAVPAAARAGFLP